MQLKTRILLAEAWRYCDNKDKSTEFMLEYMKDTANVSMDTVLFFIQKFHTWKNVLGPYEFAIYYAHSMHIYSKDQEKKERSWLEKNIAEDDFSILCPNRDLKIGDDMDGYLAVVRNCMALVASEYAGFIGKGVYLEVKHAIRHGLPVHVLRNNKLYEIDKVKEYNTDDWKTTYGQLEVKPLET